MYKKKDARRRMNLHFSMDGKSVVGHSKLSLKALENLQRELDARQTKAASILLRHQMLEHQNKVNYANEMNRIRGELSKNDTRLPIGTRQHLQDRMKALKKLSGEIK